ncbi:MAG: class II glutamine amidotransferase [Candidatus Peribacteraceae bacterium]|nr:class II glutamine amidotransferase [Candidatus Peribacteraceae bacterium]
MPEHLPHKCAVVAVSSLREGTDDAASRTGEMMHALRHRGGAGWGIATHTRKQALEVVAGTFEADLGNPGTFEHWEATDAIGHNRYITSGGNHPDMSQPFRFTAGGMKYAFAFNGNIANFDDLQAQHGPLRVEVDTEVIRLLLIEAIEEHTRENMAAVFQSLEAALDGAFNIVMMDEEGNVYAYRDSRGFHPIVYMRRNDHFAVASEDHGIKETFPGTADEEIHPLLPGQLIREQGGQVTIEQVVESRQHAHCFFEWVYFAQYLSKLDGVSVERIRERLGELLAENDPEIPGDPESVRIEPVPHSAVCAGRGYARQKDLPVSEDIERRIEARSFTKSSERFEIAKRKLHVRDDADLAGKTVVLVEDSLVRGTTMRALIENVRAKNPAAIHLRLSCPPVVALCFYGIDISNLSELIVRKYLDTQGNLTVEGHRLLAGELGVESIRFLQPEKMLQAFKEFGMQRENLCTACITGKYPTPKGQELYDSAVQEEKKKP